MTNMYRDKKIDKKFKLSHVVKYVNVYINNKIFKINKIAMWTSIDEFLLFWSKVINFFPYLLNKIHDKRRNRNEKSIEKNY